MLPAKLAVPVKVLPAKVVFPPEADFCEVGGSLEDASREVGGSREGASCEASISLKSASPEVNENGKVKVLEIDVLCEKQARQRDHWGKFAGREGEARLDPPNFVGTESRKD